jgi:hypothetical protein
MPILSQGDFAKLKHVSQKTITIWRNRGLLAMVDGGVDVEASEALLDSRPPHSQRRGFSEEHEDGGDDDGPAPSPSTSGHFDSADWSHAEAARRREIAIALKRQLDYDTACGKLVSAVDVEAIMRSDYTTTVARILQIPSKVAPRVAAMQTAVEVEALLHKEFVKALNTLSEAAGEELRKLNGAV